MRRWSLKPALFYRAAAFLTGSLETSTLMIAEGELERRLAAQSRGFRLKRAMDVMGAGAGLVLLAPFLLAIGLAIRLGSPGPALFSQLRHGAGGRSFRIYKFRSMYAPLGDPTGIAHAVPDDPRVTPLGRFLRRTSIDELPQLWNVLKGEMSLVGPRAHVVGMLAAGELYEDLVPAYPLRHLVRPGITGLAQVRGWRGDTSNAGAARKRVTCDLAYIANWSVHLDVKILFLTLLLGFRTPGTGRPAARSKRGHRGRRIAEGLAR